MTKDKLPYRSRRMGFSVALSFAESPYLLQRCYANGWVRGEAGMDLDRNFREMVSVHSANQIN